MKNLTNCSPTEFLTQATKLREPFSRWLEKTGMPELRKRKPEGIDKLTDDERVKALVKFGRENMADMVAAALEKDPKGTLEVMALACFTDPKDVNAHPMTEYLASVFEMLGSDEVRSFFTLYLKPTTSTTSEG